MPPESVLVESRAMRETVIEQVEVLDRIKALQLLPDDVHVTTEGVAAYFEIHRKVVDNVVTRHRDELESNGMRLLQGADLHTFETLNMKVSRDASASGYPQGGRRRLLVFPRRAVLNVAMLLRDSDIARRVRAYLLDAEEGSRPHAGCAQRYASLDARLTHVESCLADAGASLRELGPLLLRMSERLDSLDRRLDSTNQVVAALADRVYRLGDRMDRVESLLLHRRRHRRRC